MKTLCVNSRRTQSCCESAQQQVSNIIRKFLIFPKPPTGSVVPFDFGGLKTTLLGMPSSVVESCLFACPSGAYVYQLPAGQSSSLGHRAEMWDVDNWLCEVRVRVVERTDECFVLLETSAASVSPESAGTNDRGQGEDSYSLFAACPIPADGPLSVAVDAVVDSSRYFVLRVEDISEAATPKERRKHAFIGVGFRERTSALDFMAALQTYASCPVLFCLRVHLSLEGS